MSVIFLAGQAKRSIANDCRKPHKQAQIKIFNQDFIWYLTQLIIPLEEENKHTMTFHSLQFCFGLEITVSFLW